MTRSAEEKQINISRLKNIFFLAALVIVIILLLWFTGSKAWSFLTLRLVNVQVLEYVKMYREINVEGLLIKRETVVRAPVRGTVKYLAADGERLRLGASAATMQVPALNNATGQAGLVLKTPGTGVFCRHIDGFEQVLSPDILDVLQIPKLQKITINAANAGPAGQVSTEVIESGQPIYKLVDNLYPVTVKIEVFDIKMPKKILQSGQRLRVVWQGYSLFGKIIDYKKQGSVWDILLTVEDYPNELIHYRKIKFTVLIQELSGLLVDRKSIVLKEGQPGIYILNKMVIRWVPVTLQGQLKNKVFVSGEELTEGIRYVHNPIWHKFGSLIS